jgi:UDP-N-acetylmuramoylalanine--D-glutamate ligase
VIDPNNEFRGQRVAVIGLAATGLATAKVLSDCGATVTLCDSKGESALDAARLAEAKALEGVALRLGTSEIDWANTDLIVPSPGVPRYAAPLVEAVKRGVPVLGEIEVAYRLAKAPILAITGTNGKTTTTALLGAICREAGLETFVAGNIAEDAGERHPLIEAAVQAGPDAVIVAEISSFQLEWTESFGPKSPRGSTSRPTTKTGTKAWKSTPKPKHVFFRRRTKAATIFLFSMQTMSGLCIMVRRTKTLGVASLRWTTPSMNS